jgi:CBS domain-containing protein
MQDSGELNYDDVHKFFTRPVRYTMQARGKILDGNETVSDAVDTMKECDIGFVIVKLDDGRSEWSPRAISSSG